MRFPDGTRLTRAGIAVVDGRSVIVLAVRGPADARGMLDIANAGPPYLIKAIQKSGPGGSGVVQISKINGALKVSPPRDFEIDPTTRTPLAPETTQATAQTRAASR